MPVLHTDVRPPLPRFPRRSDPERGLPVSAGLLGVAVAGLSALVAALVLIASGATDDGWGRAVLHVLVVGSTVLTAVYAIEHRRTERFGWMLLLAGLLWTLTVLSESSSSLPYSIGRVVSWLTFPVLLHLMLAFPDGRISTRRDRHLSRAVTALVLVLYVGSAFVIETYPALTPWTSCDGGCPGNAFLVLSGEPDVVDAVLVPVREVLAVLLLVAVAASLAVRLRSTSAMRQATIAPVVAVSIVATLVLSAFIVARRAADPQLAEALGLVWTLCLPAVATAFSLGLVHRRLLVSTVLSSLSGALSASLEPRQIGAAVRTTLGDPRAEVLVPDRDGTRWVREDGTVVERSEVPAPGRELREIGDAFGPFAAVELDPESDPGDESLEAIVALGRAALREARLQEELEASLSDLDDSRKRIAMAADNERRRIERDLHDGAQQRLIALRMRLALAEDLLHEDPRAASDAIHHIGEDVEVALDEIRALAQGIYPALLADRGLADALRGAARRTPARVEVRATGLTRHPAEVESAVYFSCLEALQNVVKHGGSSTGARITLRQNGALEFEVSDDGDGFDQRWVQAGAGLRNMRDRVESLGGTLVVQSAPGRGTRVRGTVPLRGSGGGRFRRIAPAVEHGGGEAERQGQPVREHAIGQGREHRLGGGHAGQAQHGREPRLHEAQSPRGDRDLREQLRGAEGQEHEARAGG